LFVALSTHTDTCRAVFYHGCNENEKMV
jgi:hypothetical protein